QQFPSTPYASYAAFILADQAVSANDYAQAATQLQWVVDHAKANNISQLARVRLARVLLAQQQPQKALDTLDTTIDVFPGLAATVRGDAYTALGNTVQARTAYQEAVNSLPQQSALWNLVNMKLNDLPASN
ncbi:MAG: tetratricopeptide repeat protein, partial [Gammaproteobacteria bacterium]|nr:tetratricopeptide repeat protein [Gammaproteobacteria bacterium]